MDEYLLISSRAMIFIVVDAAAVSTGHNNMCSGVGGKRSRRRPISFFLSHDIFFFAPVFLIRNDKRRGVSELKSNATQKTRNPKHQKAHRQPKPRQSMGVMLTTGQSHHYWYLRKASGPLELGGSIKLCSPARNSHY